MIDEHTNIIKTLIKIQERRLKWFKFFNIFYNFMCLLSIYVLFNKINIGESWWLYLIISGYWIYRVYKVSGVIKFITSVIQMLKKVDNLVEVGLNNYRVTGNTKSLNKITNTLGKINTLIDVVALDIDSINVEIDKAEEESKKDNIKP